MVNKDTPHDDRSRFDRTVDWIVKFLFYALLLNGLISLVYFLLWLLTPGLLQYIIWVVMIAAGVKLWDFYQYTARIELTGLTFNMRGINGVRETHIRLWGNKTPEMLRKNSEAHPAIVILDELDKETN